MPLPHQVRIIVDILSALAILLGLVFVGIELRHANKLSQSEAVNSLNGKIVDLNVSKYAAPASEGLWARYYSGELDTKTDLSPSDREILETNLISWMSLYEAAWKYHETGILGADEYLGYIVGACEELSHSELNKVVWAQSLHMFTHAFVEEIAGTCQASSPAE